MTIFDRFISVQVNSIPTYTLRIVIALYSTLGEPPCTIRVPAPPQLSLRRRPPPQPPHLIVDENGNYGN